MLLSLQDATGWRGGVFWTFSSLYTAFWPFLEVVFGVSLCSGAILFGPSQTHREHIPREKEDDARAESGSWP